MVSFSEEYVMSLNDHATNFPMVFKDLLKQKQMVDVTLVADGIFVDAHRLVLSVFSPYFRQIFTQMPDNQRAFGKFYIIFIESLIKEHFFFFLFFQISI